MKQRKDGDDEEAEAVLEESIDWDESLAALIDSPKGALLDDPENQFLRDEFVKAVNATAPLQKPT